jgi:autoinducer 2-degrading protein
MLIRAVTVWVTSKSVGDFEVATAANHRGSILEPGVLRFDVLRSTDHPGEYLLYEAYESEEAAEAHKHTTHYKKWKEIVEPMMERPREGRSFSVLAPTNRESWRKENLSSH